MILVGKLSREWRSDWKPEEALPVPRYPITATELSLFFAVKLIVPSAFKRQMSHGQFQDTKAPMIPFRSVAALLCKAPFVRLND